MAFAWGFHAATTRNGVHRAVASGLTAMVAVMDTFRAPGLPVDFLNPARGLGDGVTKGADLDDGALVLMSGFFEGGNELRLIARDGTIVARWPVDYYTLFPDRSYLALPPQSTLKVDTHGAIITPEGDVVFNFEYVGTVKLDRCGGVTWTLADRTHHAVEFAEGGGYWVLGRDWTPRGDLQYPPFIGPANEDTLLRLSEDGRVVERISIPAAVYGAGLSQLMTASGEIIDLKTWDMELLHANAVAELSAERAAAFPMFAAGDLLVSERTMNAILVIDRQTGLVKWHRQGPFMRQHDAEFGADGRVHLFNNNTFIAMDDVTLAAGGGAVSNLMAIDPATGAVDVVFGDRPGQEMWSTIRGKQDGLAHGGWLVTEFAGGRVMEIGPGGDILWSYVNNFDDAHTAEITQARLLPDGYFTVDDWTCTP